MSLEKYKYFCMSKVVVTSIYEFIQIIMHTIIFTLKNEYSRSTETYTHILNVLLDANTTTYLYFEFLNNLS